jgi:multimeric flavodoxin WrbA
MRIMTILGSHRRQGNTAKALSWIEDHFRAAGHNVDPANILDYSICGWMSWRINGPPLSRNMLNETHVRSAFSRRIHQ